MKLSNTFGATVLALTTVTTGCGMLSEKPARGRNVYLVGVAGGG